MKLNELYPSKYLAADDIDGEVVGTIKKLVFEEMKDNEGNSQDKPVLYFQGVDKGMVLNKTNGTRISTIHGDETDLWIGKRITLVKEMVDAFGKSSWAIRVKPTPPPAKTKAAFQPANDEAEDGSFDTASPAQA